MSTAENGAENNENLPAEFSGGNGGNKNPPVALSSPDPDERPKGRRLSGFASPDYWTPERREAKRRYAKKMYEEGRFGGRQPGAGRPKNKTLAEVVTEESSKKADQLAKELMDMALKHKSPSVKLGAMDRIITMEQNVQKNMRDDEKELLKLSGKNLDQALSETLAEFGVTAEYDIPDEDVEEIE